jgi:DNA topoisomerase-1
VLSDLGTPASDREAKANVVLAIRLVSAELGNTPAICRASYVHPIVLARYLDHGETILPRVTGKNATGHYPEERALIHFLDEHFPERRKRVRAEDKVAA